MRKAVVLVLALALAGSAFAQMSVGISLGTREPQVSSTDPNFVEPSGAIGDFLGANPAAGQIEWFNLDQQVLVLDGTWQQFTFDLSPTGISPTGLTGNGVVDINKAVLEHIRIKSLGAASAGQPISIWIDEVVDHYRAAIPPGQPVVDKLISTFSGFADNTEVMFQEPRFSGSTSANLMATPNFSGIDNTVGHDDLSSVRTDFQFLDDQTSPARWVRLTTYRSVVAGVGTPQALPIVAQAKTGGTYSQSLVTIWLRGTPEPTSLLLLGLGTLILRRR
jgi:hypothetical protein